MSRLNSIAPEQATGKTAELFGAVQKKMGMVPNLVRVLGNSPAALESYLQFSGSLSGGVLTAKERELIALAVAEANSCDYCLAAHTALGKMAGLSVDQIRDARGGSAVDSKTDALVRFARTLVSERGHVRDADISELKDHGYTDGHVAEVVANVAINIFTNYFNHVAETEVDFPAAEKLQHVGACESCAE